MTPDQRLQANKYHKEIENLKEFIKFLEYKTSKGFPIKKTKKFVAVNNSHLCTNTCEFCGGNNYHTFDMPAALIPKLLEIVKLHKRQLEEEFDAL